VPNARNVTRSRMAVQKCGSVLKSGAHKMRAPVSSDANLLVNEADAQQ